MTIQLLDNIGVIATAFATLGGIFFVILNKASKSFRRTKATPEEILQYIEDLDKRMVDFKKEIIKEFDKEKEHAYDTHLRIFNKLEELSEGLSYIKGFLKSQSSSSS